MSQDIDSLQIEERAGQWLAWRDNAGWSQSDEAALQAWLEQSTAHLVAFVRLEAAWQQAKRLEALRSAALLEERQPSSFPDASGHAGEIPQSTASPNPGRADGKRLYAVAASILLAASGFMLWRARPVEPVGPEYSTPVGGLASVSMRDGSNVTLNTDSQIHVAVTEAERRVNLQQGEAFFEVAKDPHRPFVVTVDKRRVIAVGTAFSVRRDGDGVRVAVTEGRVKIESPGKHSAAEESSGKDVLTLSAGCIARVTDVGVLVQQKPIQEVDGDLSWRTGYLTFRDTTLAAAIEEFNRYSARKIFIEDEAVATIRLSGKFRSRESDAFVRLLEEGFPVRAQRVNDRIMLTDNRAANAVAATQN